MHRGKLHAADSLTEQIRKLIIAKTSATLSSGVGLGRGTKALWEKVKQVMGGSRSKHDVQYPVSAEQLNAYYANMSTDPSYSAPQRESTASTPTVICTCTCWTS